MPSSLPRLHLVWEAWKFQRRLLDQQAQMAGDQQKTMHQEAQHNEATELS